MALQGNLIENHPPKISVIMPTYNEEKFIENSIRSVLMQREPEGGFELLIVDGRSTDRTRSIVEVLIKQDSRIRLIDNPDRYTPFAFNAGIRAARGELIAIMGAHSSYSEDYLYQAILVREETGADDVGGSMIAVGNTTLQKAIGFAHNSFFGMGGAQWHDINFEGYAETTFGGVYHRDVFTRIGMFDEELIRNQDDEFNYRLLKSGGKIWQTPRMKSFYTPRTPLSKLWKQYFEYGYWKIRVIQKHSRPTSIRHVVPGTFVLVEVASLLIGLLSLILGQLVESPTTSIIGQIWLGIFGLSTFAYLSASILASIQLAVKHGLKYLPIFPAVFATYHLAYGSGFLKGVWNFVVFGKQKN